MLPNTSSFSADDLYNSARKVYEAWGNKALVSYCELTDATIKHQGDLFRRQKTGVARLPFQGGSMGGLARVYGPGMSGPFPITGVLADVVVDSVIAIGAFIKKIVKAAHEFMKGLSEGLSADWTKSDGLKMLSMVDGTYSKVVFSLVFPAGAVVGIQNDVVEAVKGFVDLIRNIDEIAKAIWELLKQVLEDPKMAFALGKELGAELSVSIKKKLSLSPTRFAYELGKIIGPSIIYTLLAFVGFPAVIGAKIGLWFGKFLVKFPKLAKVVQKIARILPQKRGYVLYGKPSKSYFKGSGMPEKHFDAFKQAAKEQDLIVIVRNTNVKSLELIKKHDCPPKPKNLEGIAKSSPDTGIVMANPGAVQKIRQRGYAVVDNRGIPRDAKGNAVKIDNAFWKLEKGQVIDIASKKPVVGDYDLMGVLDPKAPGRNLSVVVSNKEVMQNVTGPTVTRLQNAVNRIMKRDRVLHGAQDQYKGFDGGATVFFPDGVHSTYLPTEDAVRAFYAHPDIRRRTRTGEGALDPNPPRLSTEEVIGLRGPDGKAQLSSLP